MFWIHIYLYISSRGRMLSKSLPSILVVAWYGLSYGTLTRLIFGLDFSVSQGIVGPLEMSGVCYVPCL